MTTGMQGSVWWGRGMKTAVAGTALAMLFSLVAYRFMPETVIAHGTFAHPDRWESRGGWLLFQLLFLPGIAAFLMLMVVGTTAMGPGSLNVSADKRAYWSTPDRWPVARRRLVDIMGLFVAGFVLLLALLLAVGAGGYDWGVPFWLAWFGPAVLIGLLLWWFLRALNRAFAIPG